MGERAETADHAFPAAGQGERTPVGAGGNPSPVYRQEQAGKDVAPVQPGPVVFGFAGWSGSGKTTLIEQLIPRFIRAGLTVPPLSRVCQNAAVWLLLSPLML